MLIYARCVVLGDADRALVLVLDLGDAESADLVRRGTLVTSGVYLHKRAGSLHRGDRLVALHLQGRTNALATGLDCWASLCIARRPSPVMDGVVRRMVCLTTLFTLASS